MKIDLLVIISILITHYVADFILQSHWMASNKSKDNWALSAHVITYTVALSFSGFILFEANHLLGLIWAAVNGVIHFITDYFTSRASAKRFAVKDYHNFFVYVGADQLSHYIALLTTYVYFSSL